LLSDLWQLVKYGRPSVAHLGSASQRVWQVCRARFGPGLWPGPRRQARWAGRGLRGQRRAAGASRAAGCEGRWGWRGQPG